MFLWICFFEDDVKKATTWLQQNTEDDQRIYVFNIWDHLYALADRKAAVYPVTPTLQWYLDMPGLQQQLIDSLEHDPQAIIVLEEYKTRIR